VQRVSLGACPGTAGACQGQGQVTVLPHLPGSEQGHRVPQLYPGTMQWENTLHVPQTLKTQDPYLPNLSESNFKGGHSQQEDSHVRISLSFTTALKSMCC